MRGRSEHIAVIIIRNVQNRPAVNDSVAVDCFRVHSDDHGKNFQLGKHCCQVSGDCLSFLDNSGVLLDGYFSVHNLSGKPEFLKFTDDRSGSKGGGSGRDNDVVGCFVTGLCGRGGHGRLKLVEKLESVHVGGDNGALSIDVLSKCIDSGLVLNSLVKSQANKVILGHLDLGVSAHSSPHRLNLLAGDTLHTDDRDNGRVLDILDDFTDEFLLPTCNVCHP